MQLIEIVQLVLIGFIAISLIIFLFSYIAYRTKSKKINNNSKFLDPENKKSILLELEKVENPEMKNELPPSNKIKNKQSKFEVFKPVKDKHRIHNPKTISSNFSKESSKKK